MPNITANHTTTYTNGDHSSASPVLSSKGCGRRLLSSGKLHLFLGVEEAIVGSLKCCVVGIAKCLFHFFITRHLVIAAKPPKLQSLWCSADCVLQLTFNHSSSSC